MATPVGTNVITSLSRRFLHDQIVDNVYKGNPLTMRAIAMNKKMVQGGYQIEIPEMYGAFTAGGPYQGYDLLDISPQDTVKNAAFDWKQQYVPVTIDNLSLARADHPDAVANLLTMLFGQAQIQMADNLGIGVFSDVVSNAKQIDGIKGAIDDGTVAATYGGLARASNSWWKSQMDTTTTTLTTLSLRSLMGSCTEGGRHPTLFVTTQFIYNRYWNLLQTNQAWPVQPAGADEQLGQAGFTNVIFDGVPVMVDSHCPANHLFMINERYLLLFVKTGVDFYMDDFVKPPNQDAYTAIIRWMGNLVIMNPARNGKMTAITA